MYHDKWNINRYLQKLSSLYLLKVTKYHKMISNVLAIAGSFFNAVSLPDNIAQKKRLRLMPNNVGFVSRHSVGN